MKRDEFLRKWRCHLAGLALFGVASEVKDGPMQRAARVLEIPAEVERLLGQMFDDLAPAQGPAVARNGGLLANGKH